LSSVSAQHTNAESENGVTLFGLRMPDRIPPLSGWFLRLFQIVWWTSFVAALIGTIFFSVPEERRELQVRLDIASTGIKPTNQADNGWEVSPFAEAASAAGVRAGDIVTAVNGAPVADNLNLLAKQFGGPDGSVARLTLRHVDGSQRTVPIARNSNYIKWAYAGSGLTYEIQRWAQFALNTWLNYFLLAVSLLLVLKRAREPVAAMIAMGWTFSAIPFSAIGLPDWVQDLSPAVLFVLLPMGISLFPNSRFVSRWNWFTLLASLILVLSYSFAFLFNANSGLLYTVSIFIVFASLAVAVTVRYRRLSSRTERQQLKFFTLGLVVLSLCMMTAAMGAVITSDLPVGGLNGWADLIYVFLIAFGFTIFGTGILVSLLRYRLYDAERTISRSVALGALTLTLLAIFAGSEKVIELLGEEWFGEDLGALAGGLGAALAALMIVPLHKRLDHWAERRFQTDLTKLRDNFPLLVADLRETTAPKGIAMQTLEAVMPTLRTERGVLLTGKVPIAMIGLTRVEFNAWRSVETSLETRGLHTNADDKLLPTRVSLEAPGHGRIGWLLLGPRPDGSNIGKDEREALLAIADPLARALQVAAKRESRERGRSKQIKDHGEKIKLLEKRMTEVLKALETKDTNHRRA
jgi:hypothetical protein